MTYKWFVDVSHWNVLNDARMQELITNGCVGMIIKAGQGYDSEDLSAQNFSNLCDKYSVPKLIYHWPDPIKARPADQANYAVELAKKYNARGICPDIEQYWKNWDEWYRIMILHQPGTLQVYTPDQLTRFYTDYLRNLNTINQHKLPIMTYSAQWFFHGYCRALAPIVRDMSDDYWNAAYITWRQLDHDLNVSWEEFHLTLDNLVVPTKYMPNGINKWSAWQFAEMPKPGWGGLDCDIITEEASAKYFGTDPIVLPPPPPEVNSSVQMEVVCEGLNIRDQPSATGEDIGDLAKGAKLNILNIHGPNTWIEFERGKYACVQNAKGRYLEPHVES